MKKRKLTELKQEEEEETVNVRKEDKVNTSVVMEEEEMSKDEDTLRKTGEKTEEKKTTFATVVNPGLKSAIQKFRTISRGTECAVRSGYCTSHNIKCVREVKMKKVSEIDESGRLSWSTREVCTLTCPSKPKITTKPGGIVNSAPQGTNGKIADIFRNVMDQPTQPRTKKKTNEAISLDETR